MRPIKQLGMLTTHALLLFAPAASVAVGATLLVTHVTRFAFMFISAAMLVYAYPRLARTEVAAFWRRRLIAVGVPYVAWTCVYFLLDSLPIGSLPSQLRPGPGLVADPFASAGNFIHLLLTGYFQLYYLLILMEFYLVYPAFLWLLRVTAGRHRMLLTGSLALELLMTTFVHWQLLPAWLRGGGANKELWNYQLYLIAGGLLAWHYEHVDAWLRERWRQVVGGTVAAGALAEIWYLASQHQFAAVDASEPFQPAVVPFYLGLIASIYLIAAVATDSRRPVRIRPALLAAADNSYGIYLGNAVFLIGLSALGYGDLAKQLPWPLAVGYAVGAVYLASTALTVLLRRLPGAWVTVGAARRTMARRSSMSLSTEWGTGGSAD